MSKDMTAPNWKRTVKRLRRLMAELREHDVTCVEPPNFETPPSKRYARIIADDGPRRTGDHGLL